MHAATLTSSMAAIAAQSPSETLGAESRHVLISDLRMGDGGRKDELAGSRKALFAILGRWYLPRGYTLVLDGDIEDLRGFWLKDILASWPKLYALFDAYAEKGRLRKIVGDRDLALLRIPSYPYPLSHGLRLEGENGTILVLHGHQASPPYLGREYLSDYLQSWLASQKGSKREGPEMDGEERLKAERRLRRAAGSLGLVAIEGHTRRPLFESLTNREYARAEVERLLGRAPVPVQPSLYSPGRLVGARGLRMMEIAGDRLSLVRWLRSERGRTWRHNDDFPGLDAPYSRIEMRASSLALTFGRIDGPEPVPGIHPTGDSE